MYTIMGNTKAAVLPEEKKKVSNNFSKPKKRGNSRF
jgi:hypothetical protein